MVFFCRNDYRDETPETADWSQLTDDGCRFMAQELARRIFQALAEDGSELVPGLRLALRMYQTLPSYDPHGPPLRLPVRPWAPPDLKEDRS